MPISQERTEGRAPLPLAPSAATDDFEQFYRQQYRRSYQLAVVLAGPSDAEDLVQDAFVAAERGWVRIGAYHDPGAWVRRAVANRAVSRRRRLVNEVRMVSRVSARREPPAIPPRGGADVWDTVRSLPRRQAQVLALTYVDDLAIDAVATLLGMSVPTAKTHLRRGRQALGRRLGLDLEEER